MENVSALVWWLVFIPHCAQNTQLNAPSLLFLFVVFFLKEMSLSHSFSEVTAVLLFRHLTSVGQMFGFPCPI